MLPPGSVYLQGMEKIDVKFVVAADKVLAELAHLGRAIAAEKYAGLLQTDLLEHYINNKFNERALTDSINNFSSQWLVAYAGDEAVGFACLSSKGKKPPAISAQRSIGITLYYMLQPYDKHPALLEKCLGVAAPNAAVWVAEYVNSPLLTLFEQYGFNKAGAAEYDDELPVPFVYMIKA